MSQQQGLYYGQSAGPININQDLYDSTIEQHQETEEPQKLKKRCECTKFYVEQLHKATLIQRPGSKHPVRVGRRKNKNEVLGLILARLLKEKHLNNSSVSRICELLQGIQSISSNGEFVLVLRPDGRIIVMSDEAEFHLGKSMRSLYTQFINIYECLDETDGEKLRTILSSSMNFTQQEYRLVCTLRLPKGKRPSRDNEDVKTITMTGHFFQTGDAASDEKLFIARCEALVTPTTKVANPFQSLMTSSDDTKNSMINLTLNEDMTIDTISTNTKNVLGYTNNEIVGNWLGRYMPSNDLCKLETLRQKFFQHEQEQQKHQQGEQKQKAMPLSICEIFDMYTNHGEGRLTFLFQIRSRRQRRSKPIQFVIAAQLIDPSLRNEYIQYLQCESKTVVSLDEVEQVNLAPSSVSETIKDTILAYSPPLSMGYPMFDNGCCNDVQRQQQYSPFNRSLSNFVEPVDVVEQHLQSWFGFDTDEYSTTAEFSCCLSNSFEENSITCQSERELKSIFDEYINSFSSFDSYC